MPFIGNKPTAVPLSGADLEDNIISTAKIQDNAVTPAKYIEPVPFRNIIINGDMSIAQRGTSESGISNTAGYFTCDRWRFLTSGTGTWTQSQSTDVPSGQGFANSIKLDCTTSNTQSSADYLMLNYNIEGQDLQYLKKGTSNAESLTVSFWTKSNKTGTYTFELDDNDNNRSISKTYTVDSANTWEKKTITIEGDTTGTLDNDNNTSLRFYFWIGAGSNYTSGTLQTSWQSTTDANRVSSSNVYLGDSTNDEVYITGVQLEAGTSASDFEFLPYDVNLRRCQRYCQVLTEANTAPDFYVSLGDNANGSGGRKFQVNFPTTMRTACSTSFSSASHFETLIYETGWTDCSTIASDKGGTTSMVIETTGSNNDSRGLGTALRIENASGQITFSAEL